MKTVEQSFVTCPIRQKNNKNSSTTFWIMILLTFRQTNKRQKH